MNHFFKRNFYFFTIAFFTIGMASSCDKDMNVMLDNSIGDGVGVSFDDSFTIETATVHLENMPTSASDVVMVGKASLPESGSVKSASLFRIGFPEFTNKIPDNAVFESINLVLKPTRAKYYFGDTTATQTIFVHQLTQSLETTTLGGGIQNHALPIYVAGPSIFSHQKFAYENTPLGSLSFDPQIRRMDSLEITLDQQLGQEFFDLIRKNDVKVASNANFFEYFKGLALVPDDNNTVAIGFSDTVNVRINYSYTANDGMKKTSAKVLTTDRSSHYNQIDYDRTGTPFENLKQDRKAISTTATGGLTYVQAGTGVVTKLTFPDLQDFVRSENLSINKAELVIETSSAFTNTMYPIPGSLMLFVANADGIPTSYLEAPYVNVNPGQQVPMQQASFRPGNSTGKNGQYTFNMITYLKNLKQTDKYEGTSFYLSTVTPSFFSTFNTSVIAVENAKPKVKLNILYTKFK